MHSSLEDIPGIGKTRRRALLTHFKSIRAIAEATPEELWTLSETAGGLYMLNLYEDDLYALYDTPVWPEG